jgi:hypothetical protein
VRLWTQRRTSRDNTAELSLGTLDWTVALREVVYEDDFAHQFRYFGFSNHLSRSNQFYQARRVSAIWKSLIQVNEDLISV